jgi:hypothetical protein
MMNESGKGQRVELTRESGFHMPQDEVGNVELDVIQGYEMPKIKNNILLYISLDIEF